MDRNHFVYLKSSYFTIFITKVYQSLFFHKSNAY